MIITALFSARTDLSVTHLHDLFTSYKLTPICKRDVLNVLLNPFVEFFWPLYKYAQIHVEDLDPSSELLEEVIEKALAITCKVRAMALSIFVSASSPEDKCTSYNGLQGNLLADILKKRPQSEKIIYNAVMKHYQVTVENLPERDNCEHPFVAPLCRDVVTSIRPVELSAPPVEQDGEDDEEEDQLMDDDEDGQGSEDGEPHASLLAAQTADNGLVFILFLATYRESAHRPLFICRATSAKRPFRI